MFFRNRKTKEDDKNEDNSLVTPLSPYGPQNDTEENEKSEPAEDNNEDDNKDSLQELLDSKETEQKHSDEKNVLNTDELYAQISTFNNPSKHRKDFHSMMHDVVSSVGKYDDEEQAFISKYTTVETTDIQPVNNVKVNADKNSDINQNEEDDNDIEIEEDIEYGYQLFKIIEDGHYVLGGLDISQRKLRKYNKLLSKTAMKALKDVNSQEKKYDKAKEKGTLDNFEFNYDLNVIMGFKIEDKFRKLTKKHGDSEKLNAFLLNFEDSYLNINRPYDRYFHIEKDGLDKIRQIRAKRAFADIEENSDDKEKDEALKKAEKLTNKIFKIFPALIATCCIVAAVYFLVYIPWENRITPNEKAFHIELGETFMPTVSELFKDFPDDMTVDASSVNAFKAGTYSIITNDAFNGKMEFIATVADTTAPEMVLKYEKYQVRRTKTIKAEDLVEFATDNDPDAVIKYSLSTDTFDKEGDYTITITAEDSAGNKQTLSQNIQVVNRWTEELKHTPAKIIVGQ